MEDPRMAISSRHPCLINGRPGSQLSVADRGLAYGDGLFETIRISKGRAPLMALHLRRLLQGAGILKIPLDGSRVREELETAALELGEGLLKLIITRGEAGRGYALPERTQPTRLVYFSPLPDYPCGHARNGIQLFPCTTRLGHQPLLAGIKHLNRLEQVLARSEWQDARYAEGLVCDLLGRPIEGTMSNLFLRFEGQWLTPSLERCGVRGVMRDYLMQQLLAAGEAVVERELEFAELAASEEVFLCNSVFGVWPVIELGSHRWSVGQYTRYAQTLAEQVLL